MSPRCELPRESMGGFGRDLPTALNEDGLRGGFHAGACMEEAGRVGSTLQKLNVLFSHKWSKLHLHLQGTWSDIAQNSVNCFHTLPNIISFPQRFLFATPVGDGMMAISR